MQKILKESKARVTKLLGKHGSELREIAINLYEYDYLNQDDIDKIMQGKKLEKENVRKYDPSLAEYLNKF